MSSKRLVKKKAIKLEKAIDNNVANNVASKASNFAKGISMKRTMKAAQGLPLAKIGTVAAFAITGYTLWRNRDKIKAFIADADLPTRLGAIGDAISEKASTVSGLISGNSVDKIASKVAGSKKKAPNEISDYAN